MKKFMIFVVVGVFVFGVVFSVLVMVVGMFVCFIIKIDMNFFFVKMKEGVMVKVKEFGVNFKIYVGKIDGDSESQVVVIEFCIVDGVKGILIIVFDMKVIVFLVKKVCDVGFLVIVFDMFFELFDVVDMMFVIDNLQVGKFIGQWVKVIFGDKVKIVKVGFFDLMLLQFFVDVLCDQGFMIGFGIDLKDLNKIGDEDDKCIVGYDVINGNEEGGCMVMENFFQKDLDINVIYMINELVVVGVYQVFKVVGKEKDVLIVLVDGGCLGVKVVQDGQIGVILQQYLFLMVFKGIEVIVVFVKDGIKLKVIDGKNFFDIGVNFVIDKLVKDVFLISVKDGLVKCWG